VYDLVIIGAGPAGLAAAREAKARGLDFLVVEKGFVAQTVTEYPIGKPLFSTADELALTPGGITPNGPKPTREELLIHYTRFVVEEAIPVRANEPAIALEREGDAFAVVTAGGRYLTRTVLVATGINGFRKRLGVPGERPDRVEYRFSEAYPYAGRPVLVVGSGNSAAEVTLFLDEVGARPTLVMRRPSFGDDPVTGKPGIKWWVREPLERAIAAGRVEVRFAARVVEVGERTATVVAGDGEPEEIACDTVFALLGTTPDLHLLVDAGVQIDSDGVPVYDPDSFETCVPGIYVAGHITREKHIKGALETAPRVVERIAGALSAARNMV
jgi:putative YpdA family bacillithiol system oxidoreductase